MNIQTFIVNPIEVNCYLLHDETGEACLIDPGCYTPQERETIKGVINATENELRLTTLLCTHLHPDHIFSLDYFANLYSLSPQYSPADEQWRENAPAYTRSMGLQWRGVLTGRPQGSPLHDGDRIHFGHTELTVLATPGHSQGGLCFYCAAAGVVFTGDTLFRRSIGRADLSGGNLPQLQQSIREKLFTLPPATIVYTGHGTTTTIAEEIAHNPYF
jgi:glyoxylase-like metal-dependent hydrolase (beta-lactamase superfamily II)